MHPDIRVYLVTDNPAPFDINGYRFEIRESNYYSRVLPLETIKVLAQKWFIHHLKEYGLSATGWASELSADANSAKIGKYTYYLACEEFVDMHEGMEILQGQKTWVERWQDAALKLQEDFSFNNQRYSGYRVI